MTFLLIFFIVLFSILLALLVIKIGEFGQKRIQFMHDPVYVPSQDAAVERMVTLSKPKMNELVFDLGSGNGKVVIHFAQLGCQTVGYEIDPFLVWESKTKIQKAGLNGKAKIKWQSFWKADVSQTDLVLLFMTASIMEKLEQKLRAELKPGARVVSQRFIFPHWKPTKQLGDCYLYIQK